MDQDAATDSHSVEEDLGYGRHDRQLPKGEGHKSGTHKRIDDVIHPELFQRNDELGIHRKQEHEIHPPRSDKFRQIRQIHVEKGLKKLSDQLMGSDQENHLPLRPSADAAHIRKDHLDKNDLPQKPKDLHKHPEKKV